MLYPVKRLNAEYLDDALDLALRVYTEYEAPDYGPEGVAAFMRDIIDNESFKEACRRGENRMWGAFDKDKLVGLFVMRGQSHICMVFTDGDYHRKGIATSIFNCLLEDVRLENPDVEYLTLNSSPFGKPFYHHIGFVDTDAEKTIDGIIFTPMKYKL